MTAVFEKILEMSLTAAVVILVVLAIRLLLRKAPKKYSYALWAVAAFRLVCPVSFRSVFSIFRFANVVERVEITQTVDPIPSAVIGTSPVVTQPPSVVPPVTVTAPPVVVTTPPAVSVTPPAVTEPAVDLAASAVDVAAIIWLAVLVGLLIYGVVSYVGLRRRMANAVVLEGNVYRSDRVRSPFILGFVCPKIYLPFGLTEEQRSYVLAHERYHIRRLDHIIRPVAFLILAVHWFNPLVWAAYYLMGRDMEMSCDEKVLGGAENIRKAYSITLLSFAANRRFPSPSPLAFGETGVKGRIKNILNWKKPRLWVTIAAVIVVAAVLVACAANPEELKTKAEVWEWMSTVTAEDVTRLEARADDTSAAVYSGGGKYLERLGTEKVKVLVGKLNAVPEDALKEDDAAEWRLSLVIECGEQQYILQLSDDEVGVTCGKSTWVIENDDLDTVARGIAADALGWDLVYQWEDYETVECLYLNPYSAVAFYPEWGKGTPHMLSKNHVIAYAVPDTFGPHMVRMGDWEPLTEERWNQLFSDSPRQEYGELDDPMIRTAGADSYLVRTGGEFWLVDITDGEGDYAWAMFRLAKAEDVHSAPSGYFQSVECVYMSLLSSWLPIDGDSGYYYRVEGDTLTLVHNGALPTLGDATGYAYPHDAEGGWKKLTEEAWREMADDTLMFTDLWEVIGAYENPMIRMYEGGYFLLDLDGELWVGKASAHPDGTGYIWDLYRLEPMETAPEITVENKASFTADLNHDGSTEILTVSYDHVNETYCLTVAESMGMNVLLEWEFHRMGMLNAGYYLYSRDGKDYLLWWEPSCWQGVWNLSYEVISFDEKGGHVVLERGLRQYDTSHIGMEHLTADLDDLRAFEAEVNALLANATPLLVSQTADNGGILIGGQGGPILWASPADEWERQQRQQDAREAATLAVWPMNDLTVTLLGEEQYGEMFYTLDVYSGDYYFWETRFDRLAHNLLYFRYEEESVQYLMELSIIGGSQGIGIWSYRIFSVGPESLDIIRENELYFDSATPEAMMIVDTAALRAFEAEVNALLEHADLIAGIDNSKLVYNTPDSISTVYRMDTGHADRIEELRVQQTSGVNVMVNVHGVAGISTSISSRVSEEVKRLAVQAGSEVVIIDAIEGFDLGTAALSYENELYRVVYLLQDNETPCVIYLGFHRDWGSGTEDWEYYLGMITEEELLDRYGDKEGEERLRYALAGLFKRWSKGNDCYCEQVASWE